MESSFPKKKELTSLPKFNLTSVDFLDKLGEGNYQSMIAKLELFNNA